MARTSSRGWALVGVGDQFLKDHPQILIIYLKVKIDGMHRYQKGRYVKVKGLYINQYVM